MRCIVPSPRSRIWFIFQWVSSNRIRAKPNAMPRSASDRLTVPLTLCVKGHTWLTLLPASLCLLDTSCLDNEKCFPASPVLNHKVSAADGDSHEGKPRRGYLWKVEQRTTKANKPPLRVDVSNQSTYKPLQSRDDNELLYISRAVLSEHVSP